MDLLTDPSLGDLAIEGFTIMIIFKNMFSFALTFYAYDWIVDGGVRPTFLAISSIQLVVCLLTVPMCKCRTACPLRLVETHHSSDIWRWYRCYVLTLPAQIYTASGVELSTTVMIFLR